MKWQKFNDTIFIYETGSNWMNYDKVVFFRGDHLLVGWKVEKHINCIYILTPIYNDLIGVNVNQSQFFSDTIFCYKTIRISRGVIRTKIYFAAPQALYSLRKQKMNAIQVLYVIVVIGVTFVLVITFNKNIWFVLGFFVFLILSKTIGRLEIRNWCKYSNLHQEIQPISRYFGSGYQRQ